jgi:hypothetical protein
MVCVAKKNHEANHFILLGWVTYERYKCKLFMLESHIFRGLEEFTCCVYAVAKKNHEAKSSLKKIATTRQMYFDDKHTLC